MRARRRNWSDTLVGSGSRMLLVAGMVHSACLAARAEEEAASIYRPRLHVNRLLGACVGRLWR
jgi:hypothetical protein